MLARWLQSSKRDFSSLNEKEILSLAVGAEEEDAQIYAAYADMLRES
ncbi:MAG TPA: rubrerythrin family protein, partial [Devosia sp.]|nr:rubrerythrin family protein [Devosia sp.]